MVRVILLDKPVALSLLLLAALPALLYAKARRSRSAALRALGGKLPRLEFKLALSTAAIALLALAVAEPYLVATREVEVPFEEAERLSSKVVLHVLVLDASRSMLVPDAPPSRCDAARAFAEEYLRSLSGSDLVALVIFSGEVQVKGPMPSSSALASLSNYSCDRRYSAVGDALSAALGLLKVSGLPGAVIALTDGGWNYGANPLDVARGFKELNVTLVVVRVGWDPRGSVLYELASRAGGRVYELDRASAPLISEMAREAGSRARYEALRARGLARVSVEEKVCLPAELFTLLAAALILAALVDGV